MSFFQISAGVKHTASKAHRFLACSYRTIPPEQQAEADELAAALSELQTTTMHEYQEVVGGEESLSEP